MDMEQTVAILYERVGQFLAPRIHDGTVKGHKPPTIGTCLRTGINGLIVPYVERIDGDRVTIPTLTTLLWAFAEQRMLDKHGVVKSFRIGKGRILALLDDEILTTIPFESPLPRTTLITKSNELLREIIGRKCLFLAFSDRPAALLENGLRWSTADQLEINGKLALASDVLVSNAPLNLARSIALTKRLSKRAAIDLRRLLEMQERSEQMQQKLVDLAKDVPMETLQMLYKATKSEMIMAYRLWNV